MYYLFCYALLLAKENPRQMWAIKPRGEVTIILNVCRIYELKDRDIYPTCYEIYAP